MRVRSESSQPVRSEWFEVEVGSSNGAAHVRMAGRFDVMALKAFEQAVAATLDADVVLDLRDVLAIDAAAWLAVVTHEERLRDDGRKMRLVNVPRGVRRIFQITGSDHLIDEAASV